MKKGNENGSKSKAFTLIELLVVIAILAVLAVAVTLILNPAELIRQGRDSTRLSDLATINRALGLYQTDQIAKWMGTSTVVYTSLPDTTSTCASYGLPSLPSGWEYHCVQSSSSTRVNGTGWIPVDFTSMSFSSPLARLPLDPVNEATSSKYYTYVSGGSWKLSAVFESETRATDAADDGGSDLATYEVGTNLDLAPFTHGLVGYWAFDDGSGTTAADSSGYGNDGTLTDASSTNADGNTPPQWTSGKKNGALNFDGVDDYANIQDDDSLDLSSDFTVEMWIYPKSDNTQWILWKGYQCCTTKKSPYQFLIYTEAITFSIGDNSDRSSISQSFSINNWYHVVGTYDGSEIKLYINGSLESSSATDITPYVNSYDLRIGTDSYYFFNAFVDDTRLYNRALSAAEVEAMYNSY